jgi:arylsulfatase A-like enzyme
VWAPGLARARLGRGLAALAAVAAAGAVTALVLAGRPPAPFGTPSAQRDAAPSLVLPEGTPVILILVDTLRADHLSYAGYRRDTSPTVDRLAREGVVFERVIAQATRTSPNMASLLTGTGPATHGLVAAQSRLDQDLVTWGEILAGHGYGTAGILGNPNMGHRFEFTQGMQHVDEAFSEPAFDAGVLFPRGLAWLAERGRDPYFLWIHAIDPHSPYAAPGPARDRYQADETHRAGPSDALPLTESRFGGVYPEARLPEARSLSDYVARYDAEIRFFDEALAAFLSGLDVEGGVPPLIVFTSDHGESLGEHDYFFSHGNFTHDATARVPLVFHHPRLPAGLRVPRMVRTIDVLPTVLELLGFDVPPSVEGRSLVPLIAGGSLDPEPAVIFAGFPERVEAAVRDERYKLIARPLHAGLFDRWTTARLRAWPSPRRTSPLQGPRYELHLYDLAADPGETANLYGQLPDVERALRSRLLAYVDNHRGSATNRRVADQELSDEMREQLRALGYVE